MKIAQNLVLVAAALGSLAAWGDGDAPDKKPAQVSSDGRTSMNQTSARNHLFGQLDTDADGSVSLQELRKIYPRVTQDRFSMLDSNGDGALDQSEASKAAGRTAMDMRERFRDADANGDGQLTYEELHASDPRVSTARFQQMDRNRDGVLSPADRQPAQRGNDSARNETRGARADAATKLMETDGNGDRTVSFEEVIIAKPGFPRDAFDRYDTNKDGVLSSADHSSR